MKPKRKVREIPSAMTFDLPRLSMVKKVKVAAYARVSTEKEEQEDSFERQVEYYTVKIKSNPEWDFVEVYADPGITGTRAEKRPNFMRMIEDCRVGKIDKILVKSISRFARNTVDALNYIRELKDMSVSVCFENENIDTLTPGGEVLITILAAMAEQESRTMSTNIKWSYQKKFQNGEVTLNTKMMLGYKKAGTDEDGHTIYEIEESEAAIVRRIFREYIAGVTATRICRGLEADGILTKTGKIKWQTSVIRSILSNEKYTGNAVLGKTFKADVLSKKRQKNTGQAPMYYVEDTHPAIIDREMWELARREEKRRNEVKERSIGAGRYSSKYALSGLLTCAHCGHAMRRQLRTVGSGKKIPSWGCTYRIENGRHYCVDSRNVREDVLLEAYLRSLNKIAGNIDDYLRVIRQNCTFVMTPKKQKEIADVEQAIIDVQEKVLELHKQKREGLLSPSAFNQKVAEQKAEMEQLQEQQQKLYEQQGNTLAVEYWLNQFQDATDRMDEAAVESTVIKTLVDKIVVDCKRNTVDIHFKCGVTITETIR